MKKVSATTVKSLAAEADSGDPSSIEVELRNVAQSFIILQQARHDADYNLEQPLDGSDAIAHVDQAGSAFASWEITGSSNAAKDLSLRSPVQRAGSFLENGREPTTSTNTSLAS